MLNIGVILSHSTAKNPIRYLISYKFKRILLPAGNVINDMHISYIIDLLYNWTNFMSNIPFIFKFIMDWVGDRIVKSTLTFLPRWFSNAG